MSYNTREDGGLNEYSDKNNIQNTKELEGAKFEKLAENKQARNVEFTTTSFGTKNNHTFAWILKTILNQKEGSIKYEYARQY